MSVWRIQRSFVAGGSRTDRRTKRYVGRKKQLNPASEPSSLTRKNVQLSPIHGNQNIEQIIRIPRQLQHETEHEQIAVILDHAGCHHAKARTELDTPGQLFEHTTPIYLPPHAPDHTPTEHVWNTTKKPHRQPPTRHPGKPFAACTSSSANHTLDDTFKHPTQPKQTNDLD